MWTSTHRQERTRTEIPWKSWAENYRTSSIFILIPSYFKLIMKLNNVSIWLTKGRKIVVQPVAPSWQDKVCRLAPFWKFWCSRFRCQQLSPPLYSAFTFLFFFLFFLNEHKTTRKIMHREVLECDNDIWPCSLSLGSMFWHGLHCIY